MAYVQPGVAIDASVEGGPLDRRGGCGCSCGSIRRHDGRRMSPPSVIRVLTTLVVMQTLVAVFLCGLVDGRRANRGWGRACCQLSLIGRCRRACHKVDRYSYYVEQIGLAV